MTNDDGTFNDVELHLLLEQLVADPPCDALALMRP